MIRRVIVADDHPMCREAARLALSMVAPEAEIAQASTLEQVLADPVVADMVVLDLGLPDSRGIASLIDVARARPTTPILIVSGAEAPDVEARVASNGAAGFVSKAAPIDVLIEAIRTVAGGGSYFASDLEQAEGEGLEARLALLTPAEARVLRAMRGGDLNKQIAYELNLSEITVKQHVKAILRKLQVVNRTQAILLLHDVQR